MTVGIIFLLVGTFVISSPAQNAVEKKSLLTQSGNILYVGGNGEGNYTKIQDAIDDASPGDTIYVYDDSSPYYENVVVNKSITLIGEDKTSTEINGSSLDNSLNTVNVMKDHVTISGFRITNNHGYYYQAAVKIVGDYVTLSNCFIYENEWIGIYLVGASFCHIVDCELYENLVAVHLVGSRNNILQNCMCHDNADAMTLFESSDDNQITNCTCDRNSFDGIHIQQSSGNQITGCVCTNGYDGISLPYAPNTKMRNNTMTGNYANFGIGSSSVTDFYCDIDTSNTINGKTMYYLIGQDNLSFDETAQIGFLGLVSCQNISVKNCNLTNNFEGMLLAGTTDSFIENCSFSNNDGHGMYLISSQYNTVKNCTFRDSFWDGVFLYDSSNNSIENSSFDGSLAGINLALSSKNILRGLTIDQCNVGISFDASGNNVLKDNSMVQCGLQVTGSNPAEYRNDVDASNTVNGKPIYYYLNQTNRTIPSDAGQVILITCSHCIVSHCNLSDASIGVELAYSTKNTIEDNILTANNIAAIDLDGSDNDDNIISDNLIQGNNYGIDIDSSDRNMFQDNIVTDNGMGFSFDNCWENTIIGNTVQDGYYGIYLDHSPFNNLTYNTIRNTSVFGLYLFYASDNVLDLNAMINCSLMVYGNDPSYYQNDVDVSNTVNGKSVYYLLHQTSSTIPDDAGEVILIGSSHCTIKDLDLNKGTVGITLAYSWDNIIKGNIIKNQSMIAIDLGSAGNNDNTIQGNIIQENGYGIDLEYSKGNTIRQNRIVSNGYGVFLSNTLDTIIRRNTISRNNLGISATEVNESKIYLNNIYQNYIYGLSAEACVVTARWNWWGATTGPSTNGNGDHLSVTKDGQITYAPWKRFPVLFAGILSGMLINSSQENYRDTSIKTPGEMSFDSNQITDYRLDLFGIKNIHHDKERALPKDAIRQYFDE